MNKPNAGQWMAKIRSEVEKGRRCLQAEREKLAAERLLLEDRIQVLEQELQALDRLDTQAAGAAGASQPERLPLSRRVLKALGSSESELTSHELRTVLQLDQREARNLGPVLNQLAKRGKVTSAGRGSPWRRVP